MSGKPLKQILPVILIILFGLAIGYTAERRISEKAPLPLEFLASPIVDKLYANVEGRVIAKTVDSLTLEKNGKQITMLIEEKTGLTTFFWKNNQSAHLDFGEILIGDNLEGGVSIILSPKGIAGLLETRKIGDVIAQRFVVSR